MFQIGSGKCCSINVIHDNCTFYLVNPEKRVLLVTLSGSGQSYLPNENVIYNSTPTTPSLCMRSYKSCKRG